MADSHRSDVPAKELLDKLTSDLNVSIPTIDFSKLEIPDNILNTLKEDPTKLTNDSLTERIVDGNGVFDILMTATKAHLKEEFNSKRIIGAEYTKAYINAMQICMQAAVQFLLGRDQAQWQAVMAQMSAYKIMAEVAVAKVQAAKVTLDAYLVKTQYGKSSIELATTDTQWFSMEQLLPWQRELLTAQANKERAQSADEDKDGNPYGGVLGKQMKLLMEQAEQTRGATADVRFDGNPIVGSIGKQKALYDQQITSYKRDAEIKAGKLWTDSWLTRKTMDSEEPVPEGMDNDHINAVVDKIRQNNGLI